MRHEHSVLLVWIVYLSDRFTYTRAAQAAPYSLNFYRFRYFQSVVHLNA